MNTVFYISKKYFFLKYIQITCFYMLNNIVLQPIKKYLVDNIRLIIRKKMKGLSLRNKFLFLKFRFSCITTNLRFGLIRN
jgi:hypothetical protein